MKSRITRRELLRGVAIGSLGVVFAACQPKVVEKIVEKEVTKVVKEVVKETVVVEGEAKEVTKIVEKVVTSTPAPSGPVNLLVIPGINPDQGTEPFWKSVKDLYEETYPGRKVDLNIQPSWDTVWSSIQGAIAAGEPPDVWMTQENGPGTFWENGATLALEELASADSRWTGWCNSVSMQLEEEYTYNQHLIAVPIYTSPMMWLWNKKAFEDAGLESYPKTLDEVISTAKTLQANGIEYPYWIGAPGGWAGHWLLWSFGAPGMTDKSGEQQMLDSPEFLAACEWYWNLIHVHKIINPDYLKQFPNQAVEAANGKIVLWEDGPWGIGGYRDNEELFQFLGIAPRAAGPAGAIQNVGGSALMISAKTKFPTESWDFCMVANDPDNLADNWLIPYYDTVSNCEAFKRPQVQEKAPLVFEMLAVMESEGRVVWTVPWYWDVVSVADSMQAQMWQADSWTMAKALVDDFAAEAQAKIEEGISKFGKKE